MPVPGAPTVQSRNPATQNTQPASQPAALIPFTRAARKKRRLIGQYGPYTLSANTQQLPPIQVPANGFLRKLILDTQITASGNSATVAWKNDAPFNVFQQIGFTAANGDTIKASIDGFAQAMDNKYGAYSVTGAYDQVANPNWSRVAGSGGTGGSSRFELKVDCEFDSRDGAGSLANMAANQSFNLNLILNTLGNLYSTAPTAAPTVTITVTAEYWAAPAAANLQGVPQQTTPRCNNLVNLLQVLTPPIVPSTTQDIQLTTVGNTIRHFIFILRDASGNRTETDWPTNFAFAVNNDQWDLKTKTNWRNQMANDYDLFGGVQASPTVNSLDTGVFVYTDFINDGSAGPEKVSGASNRDLMLVTGSGTGIDITAASAWGSGASSLQVLCNSLRVPDTSAFYAPFCI